MLEEFLQANLVQTHCWWLSISVVDLIFHTVIIRKSSKFQFDRLDMCP